MALAALRRWRAAVDTRPRLARATKAALAAAIAWLCVLPIGGFADDYPYYAPLGAVIAVSSTFASSLRSVLQAIGAIGAGAAIAVAAQLMALPEAAAVALAVAAGVLVGGWRRLGEMAGWVPISALFVLIIGGDDPSYYVGAYLGLTGLGAVVGLLVNGVFPPLPLTATSVTLRRLRSVLADQLDDLADGLLQPGPPDPDEWQQRRLDLSPHVTDLHQLAQQVSEARRANWRERRWHDAADLQHAHALTLLRLSGLVEELVALVSEREQADFAEVALGPRLRPVTAPCLQGMAAVLRARPEDDAWDKAFAGLTGRIEELQAAVRRAWRDEDQDRFSAAAIVVALERAAQSLQETAEAKGRLQASSSE